MNVEKARAALRLLQEAFVDGDGASPAPQTPASEEKKYVDKSWFQEVCFVLGKNSAASQRDKEALESLPRGLAQYGSLTAKQWRLFCAIHKNLMGDWPKLPVDSQPAKTPAQQPLPEDLTSIPF